MLMQIRTAFLKILEMKKFGYKGLLGKIDLTKLGEN
jgi:hypothetical protein